MLRHYAVVLLVVFAMSLSAQEGTAADANALYQAGKWTEALPLYQQMTKAEPSNGQAWYRTGVALHHLGRIDEAIVAYLRAADLKFAPAFTSYNLAATYALKKQPAKAYEWLEKSLAAGFRDDHGLSTDEDFASMRGEEHFKTLLATVEKNAHPCRGAEYRALDFWIGEWNVRDTRSGQQVGMSSIQPILGDCVVLEKWTGGMGGSGQSFNTIDPATGKWRQTWTDNSGEIYDFSGEPSAGRMVYVRTMKDAAGKPSLNRMTLSKLPTGEVRQFSEQSSDNGATWSVAYDFTYKAK